MLDLYKFLRNISKRLSEKLKSSEISNIELSDFRPSIIMHKTFCSLSFGSKNDIQATSMMGVRSERD